MNNDLESQLSPGMRKEKKGYFWIRERLFLLDKCGVKHICERLICLELVGVHGPGSADRRLS